MLTNWLPITDHVAMGELAVAHFKSILAPQVAPTCISTPNWFQSLLDFRCSEKQCLSLTALPSREIIEKTLLRLNQNKAPGPDGLTSGFYKAAWSIIGHEVLDSIYAFFSNAFLPAVVNSTILSLAPKHPGASAISDYPPIFCCTTIYKSISKVLVAKLKPLLSDLVLPNQTAFIQG